MRTKKIVVLNLNDTQRDPRVRRVAATMARAGHQVTVCELGRVPLEARDTLDGFEIMRIESPQSYTQHDMQAIEDLCTEAGAILRHCAPEVMEDTQATASRLTVWHALRRLGRMPLLRRFYPSAGQARRHLLDIPSEILAIRSIMLINLALYRAAARLAPDLVYCNDLDTLLVGVLCKIRQGTPLCYDAHEIYPEQFAEHMRTDIWHRFYTRLEHRLLPYTDGRLTVCDSLGDYFVKTYGSAPFVTLRNTPSLQYLPDETILKKRPHPLRMLYHGNYFQYRGLDEIIAVADKIEGAVFVFRGMGAHEQALRAQVEQRQLAHRVRFEAPVTVNELIPMASQCDVGLSPFLSVCRNTEYALPNKFFEYMMAGLALASADLIEMRLLTQSLENGVLFDARSPESIVQSLQSLIQDHDRLQEYRQRSYMAAKTRFHWEYEEGILNAYLRNFL